VVHAYSPSYSGGRDQEDHGFKPAQAKSPQDPILKKTHHKKGLAEWLKVKALSSSPGTTKKKKSEVDHEGLGTHQIKRQTALQTTQVCC
jgi:hypothetical protein